MLKKQNDYVRPKYLNLLYKELSGKYVLFGTYRFKRDFFSTTNKTMLFN